MSVIYTPIDAIEWRCPVIVQFCVSMARGQENFSRGQNTQIQVVCQEFFKGGNLTIYMKKVPEFKVEVIDLGLEGIRIEL